MTRKRFDAAPVFNVHTEGVLIQQAAGSTADLFVVKDHSDNVIMSITASGEMNTHLTTLSTNSATTIYSFPAATYRSAEFTIQVTQGSKYTVSKVLLIHNDTTPYLTEFGVLEIGASRIPLHISTAISSGNVLLQATVTDAATTSAYVKLTKNLIGV